MKKLLNTILIAGVLSACNNDDNGGGTPPPSPPPDPLDPLRRISISLDGDMENGDSQNFSPYAVSGDGRYVVFYSTSSNLLAEDTDTIEDAYMYDAQSNQLRLVSVNNDQIKGDNPAFPDSVSANGRYVFISTKSSALLDGQQTNFSQLALRDTVNDSIEVLSKNAASELGNGASFEGVTNEDGRYVVFTSDATNLAPNDTSDGFSDIYLLDRNAISIKKISEPVGGGATDGDSFLPGISTDGRYIVFQSAADNLVDNDTNNNADAFIYDAQLDTLKRISEGNGNSIGRIPIISKDGRFVVFRSTSALIEGDPSGNSGVYLYTIDSGELSLVSLAENGSLVSNIWSQSVNGDGRYVAFSSMVDGIVDGDDNGAMDIFIRDTIAGETQQLDIGGIGLGQGATIAMSADGRYVVTVTANALTVDDENGLLDVYRAPNPFLVE